MVWGDGGGGDISDVRDEAVVLKLFSSKREERDIKAVFWKHTILFMLE